MQYITLGKRSLSKKIFEDPKNTLFIKPNGGLWGSEYTPNADYVSSWDYWCAVENFACDRKIGVVYELLESARIYTIDSLQDLKNLLVDHAYTCEFIKEYADIFGILDFEKISQEYDVINLTDRGQYATRYSRPSLYGWDVSCILVLNYDVIKNIKTWKRG